MKTNKTKIKNIYKTRLGIQLSQMLTMNIVRYVFIVW